MNILAIVLVVLLVLVAALASVTLLSLRSLSRRFDTAIHESVAAALAEDREREMAEARTFWAEQEARMAEDSVYGEPAYGDPLFDSDNLVLLPAPRGYVDDEGEIDPEFSDALRSVLEEMIADSGTAGGGSAGGGSAGGSGAGSGTDSAGPVVGSGTGTSTGSAPGLPAAVPTPTPAHPSVPGFVPQQTPTPEWTDLRLTELVAVGTVLRDVRSGPMGTLDVYVFEDETTLCIAPGDAEAGARLRKAMDEGSEVRLLGSSRLTGAHALTFALGGETDAAGAASGTDAEGAAVPAVYILADRVIASL